MIPKPLLLLTRTRLNPLALVLVTLAFPVSAQVTTPRQHFGFSIGDDYHLANYTQFDAYWRTLAAESPRMVVEEIGRTAEGRPQLMAIVTSPENHARLDRYREIARRLTLAENLSEDEARTLAREGRAVVWIDGGLHGSEVLGAHQLIETVYRMVSGEDEETLRLLDDVIMLFVHANPDGMELVSDWYMREPVPERRRPGGEPQLYHKYIGHDNNRDFYLVSQPETENMARVLYREWFPQILYNHHQTGPAGTVMFAPPFREPFNYNIDPLVLLGIEMAGNAMHSRFIAEDKPGTTLRDGGPFSTWWNGGLRTTAYFHNIIGLLTETIGHPTPVQIPFMPNKQLPTLAMPYPIGPREWHFRESIEYSVTANQAVLDYASRYRETLLLNIYRMGRNSIERGSRDHWTLHPKRIASLMDSLRAAGLERQLAAQGTGPLAGYFSTGVPPEYADLLRRPEDRDARGYILPADQRDFLTATKFVNTLIKNGITVHRAARDFAVAGTRYPAGSYVVKTAQAFRPHIIDMFEPQDHPDDIAYEGAPPTPPYDNAGWTLAYLMGVEFDRVRDGFEGPFEPLTDLVDPPAATFSQRAGTAGFLLSHDVNDAAVAANRLLAAGDAVYWITEPLTARGTTYPAGTIFIPSGGGVERRLETMAAELGLQFQAIESSPGGEALQLSPARIGLWDRYGGSMPSGWTRWLLEQFEFPFEVVYPQTLEDVNLRRRFDVLIFPTGAIPASDREEGEFDFFDEQPDVADIPSEFRGWLGEITVGKTVPNLLRFLEEGGTIITIGSSTVMGRHANLPVGNHLVDGDGRPLTPEHYYVPGSVLRVRVDTTQPLAYGMRASTDVFFNNSPVLRLKPEAQLEGVRPVAWFDSREPLRSGWAWGQHRLEGGVAVAEAAVGTGRLYLFGPEILNRGQPHGTFKFLFNGVHLATAKRVRLGLTN